MFGKLSGTTTIFTHQPQSQFYPSPSLNFPKTQLPSQKSFKHAAEKTELAKDVLVQPKTKLIVKQKKAKPSVLKEHEQHLKGSKFRLLNEMLYTRDSNEAVKYFTKNASDFDLYHEGYRRQSTKWEQKPVDSIIQYLVTNAKLYRNKIIGDLGCGQGFLYEALIKNGFNPKNIKSYDLISTKPFIESADISHLPLQQSSLNLTVFCLSLMGTNYLDFIIESWRVLKDDGIMIISEVQSRSQNWRKFIQMIEAVGFVLMNNGKQLKKDIRDTGEGREQKQTADKESKGYFRTMMFGKRKEKRQKIGYKGSYMSLSDLSKIVLSSCSYKKR